MRQLFIKDETCQISGAFKFRGSTGFLSAHPGVMKLVTASTGNHALGLSEAARRTGRHCTIFVPETTPRYKFDRLERIGTSVYSVGRDYAEAVAAARNWVQVQGGVYVESFDDPDVISGHMTLGEELRIQLPAVSKGLPDRIFVPVGGGGLLCAMIGLYAGSSTRIVGVEIEGYSRLSELPKRILSIPSGMPGLPSCEGITVRSVGAMTSRIIMEASNLECVTVSFEETVAAAGQLFARLGVRAELSSCTAVAAAIRSDPSIPSIDVVILTGGNIAPELFDSLVRVPE